MDMNSLNNPSNYPHAVSKVEWRETHISWVILTGEFVYKIKKPVDFGFVNFSSIDLRKSYCEEEVRLNRRTAPALYLGVVSLCENHGQLNFSGQGQVVDYAVKMRQFDPDALLSSVLKNHSPSKGFIQTLAYDLARFHGQAIAAGNDFDVVGSVTLPVVENFRQIKQLDSLVESDEHKLLDTLEVWSLTALKNLEPTFYQRHKRNRIKECHGDLHLGNIAVVDENPLMFDCIEFNDQFRWIDCASDLAFLIMDLEFHGYPDIANNVLNRYLEYSLDYHCLSVMNFYKVYRAMVRAKVALLAASQAEPGTEPMRSAQKEFNEYVQFAADSIPEKSPFLVLTSGVSGTGKSTFATEFCAYSDAIHIKSDVVRKRLAGLAPTDNSEDVPGLNLYSEDSSQRTFAKLHELASFLLSLGYGVVVDATFLTVQDREPFLTLARDRGIAVVIAHLMAPEEVLGARIEQRLQLGLDSSEATVAVMGEQLKRVEGFNRLEKNCVIEIDNALKQDNFNVIMATLGQPRAT